MVRGAWQATVHRVTTVGHDLPTKPPPQISKNILTIKVGKVQTKLVEVIEFQLNYFKS